MILRILELPQRANLIFAPTANTKVAWFPEKFRLHLLKHKLPHMATMIAPCS